VTSEGILGSWARESGRIRLNLLMISAGAGRDYVTDGIDPRRQGVLIQIVPKPVAWPASEKLDVTLVLSR